VENRTTVKNRKTRNGRRVNFDVPAEVVLRVIASGSNSGSTATLEDMLRVEYERDADANLMADIDNVDFSFKQRFKLLN